MRLPGHEQHQTCEECDVFDQVHAERDDLRLTVARLEGTIASLAYDRDRHRGASEYYRKLATGVKEQALYQALKEVAAHLGPMILHHGCEGCEAEMGEALRIADEALRGKGENSG